MSLSSFIPLSVKIDGHKVIAAFELICLLLFYIRKKRKIFHFLIVFPYRAMSNDPGNVAYLRENRHKRIYWELSFFQEGCLNSPNDYEGYLVVFK